MIKNFNNAKISIIGAGKTGISCANYFLSEGSKVFLSDKSNSKDIERIIPEGVAAELGGHTDKLLDADLIIPCPDVNPGIPVLVKARELKIPVLTDIAIFASVADYKMIIAITGTNGKTTVTSMVAEALAKNGKKTIVCGNIGNPACDFIKQSDKNTYVVMEVSSYQLEYTVDFAPHISAILNITPDHLERHKSMENYIFSKSKIFSNQKKKDFCVLNFDDPLCRELAAKVPADIKYFSVCKNKCKPVLKIPGEHNIANALAALEILKCAGMEETEMLKSLSEFAGVEHRIEFVRNICGITYINDSKATNVSSTEVALKSFSCSVILILGGRDKGFPYTPLIPLIMNNVKMIIAIGEAKGKIYKELSGTGKILLAENLKQAVLKAKEIAVSGDTVLLSPACSSYDQFKNYEERGRVFKNIVGEL